MSTISSAGCPARSIAARIGGIGVVTPVDVSLCTTHTALIACPVSARKLRLDLGRVGAVPPVAGKEVDGQRQPLGELVPQRGEVAGLGHQHAIARRQRVDERRFPRAGARRRVDDDVAARSGTRASCRRAPSCRAPRTRGRDGRSSGGRSRAARDRARWSGPGSAGSGGRRGGCRVEHRIAPSRSRTVANASERNAPPAASEGHIGLRMNDARASRSLFRCRRAAQADLARALRARRARRGAVRRASRGRYATDASIYQVEPVGVLVPKSHDDVRAASTICRELRVPMLPRGAGSSQCGQTVGAALVIDHSKHLYGDRRVRPRRDDGHRRARHRARRAQRVAASPHGLWFPVDVSTSAQATLGGMAGNNSCGSRSIAYGNMVHNVVAIDALLADGTEARFGPESEMAAAARRASRAARKRCARSRARERDEIERRVPKVLRRVGGYNLDVFQPQSERPYTADGSVNFAHLLVGSEGTLAWTQRAHAAARAAARAAHARRRQLSDAAPRDAVRAAHRHARAVGGRAGRPHDDRARAQQSRVPAGHRRRADRRAGSDPAGRVHGDDGRPLRRLDALVDADRRSRPAGSGRAHDRCRRRRRRCGTCARPGSTS